MLTYLRIIILAILLSCSKEKKANFDLSIESSCVDLSGSNFPSPLFHIKAQSGDVLAGTSFTVTFNKRLRANYIRAWNGNNVITVESVSSDERSAVFKINNTISAGREVVVYLDQMMTKGDVATVALNGKDQNNNNNRAVLKVQERSQGSNFNVCITED